MDAGTLDKADRDIAVEAERLDVKDKATLVLAELLINGDMMKQIPKYRVFFLRVGSSLACIRVKAKI